MSDYKFNINISEKNWENFINSITFGCYSWVSLVQESVDSLYLTNYQTQKSYVLTKDMIESVIWELIIYRFTPVSNLKFENQISYDSLMTEDFLQDLNLILNSENSEFSLGLVNILCQLAFFEDILYD